MSQVEESSERPLRICLVQEASTLEPELNRSRLGTVLAGLVEVDLAVLPEAFQREFGEPGSDVSAYAEELDGPFVTALDAVAVREQTTVCAGMFERSPDPTRPFNTLVVRGAVRAAYRKIHLYDSFGYRESEAIHPGAWEPQIIELSGWRIGLMTCYDLRFPELARELVAAGAEVLVVPAAWVAGERKVDHWRTLVRARAIENVCYVIAVGQPGPRYCGHSLAVDPLGDVLVEAGPDGERTFVELERSVLSAARRTNPSLDNRRR